MADLLPQREERFTGLEPRDILIIGAFLTTAAPLFAPG
jgi:hypothetical protein